MISFVRSQLVHRFPRVAALGTGVLVAAVGFTLLTSAVDTGALTVQGTINANFRPAYDILVRPASSYTPIERERGLVRSNYLSGMYGGISRAQWHEILGLPGVEVAAPIANIGSIMPFTFVPLQINKFLSDDDFQVYRLEMSFLANNATSRYPAGAGYVYYQRRDPLVKGPIALDEVLPNGRRIAPCGTFNSTGPQGGTSFNLDAFTGLTCFSALSPQLATSGIDYGPFPDGYVGYVTAAYFPMLISAIDPVQEQLLLGLDSTVVSGQPLTENLGPERIRQEGSIDLLGVPVLASTKTYVDETLDVVVERLDPGAKNIVTLMGDDDVRKQVTALSGAKVGSIQIPISEIYASLLRGFGRGGGGLIQTDNSWAAGTVSYRSLGVDRLAPMPMHNPYSVYLSASGGAKTPWENKDVQFRELTPHFGSNHIVSGLYQTPFLRIVGRFDPALLPGFSALSQVPLESYYPPSVEPADEASTEALGGKPLLPTQNLADYIAQPPLLLTTMRGLRPFMNESFFYPAIDAKAPISAIRVRVADVTGADSVSLARIRTVAELIHERTGLSIDITAGSSPRPMQISLPAGKFGRPPLEVNEPWVETGVAVRFLRALDTKSLLLFMLVLVVCVLFLANASFASVRVRRKEIGTLLCLGWSKKDISRVILVELAVIGLVAGVVGSAVAWALAKAIDIDLELWKVLAIPPISILLTVLAGILPARRTAAITPMDAVSPPVVERGRTRRVRGPATMALANLARIPSRTLVAAFGLFIGVAALSILVAVNAAFEDALVGTLLGRAISLEVRPVDFLSVALVIALAGLSVADVLYLNIRERAAELVTLRTSGWRRRDEISLVAFEALGIGGLGSVAGAALGMLVSGSVVRGVGIGPVVQGGATGIAVGVLAALLASIVPAIRLGGLTPSVVLSEE
jgi:ABC-type lipoprotein release transport system permease subunit